ncbi:hypothetical protein Ccrd_011398 [Cynara cardunculus var. scolymus]|uniref:Uncharacterized protein n=1 Tax=Cynara cardunculus var. scolymus TaxID=59895 RepID=A0A103YJD6_CYNCS|nr:hypothetical protein Ccrd_011398 [Cynara cardunculus var. scolymus]
MTVLSDYKEEDQKPTENARKNRKIAQIAVEELYQSRSLRFSHGSMILNYPIEQFNLVVRLGLRKLVLYEVDKYGGAYGRIKWSVELSRIKWNGGIDSQDKRSVIEE